MSSKRLNHTYRSEVNITRLPAEVMGVLATPRGPEPVTVAIKSAGGELLESTEAGRNCAGVVLVSDQRVFAAREVAKVDARPGGYVAVGGHGGILGSAGGEDAPILPHIPAMKPSRASRLSRTAAISRRTGSLPRTMRSICWPCYMIG